MGIKRVEAPERSVDTGHERGGDVVGQTEDVHRSFSLKRPRGVRALRREDGTTDPAVRPGEKEFAGPGRGLGWVVACAAPPQAPSGGQRIENKGGPTDTGPKE